MTTGGFLHSFVQEQDPFLKKQMSLGLLAPILACLFFVCFLLPGVLGLPQVRFTYFALFSSIIAFALPLAMDNRALYQEQLAIERTAQREKEHVRAEVHDIVLNNLAAISLSTEVALTHLNTDLSKARNRLLTIQGLGTDTSRYLRGFLEFGDEHSTWEELSAALQKLGFDLVEPLNLEFEFLVSPSVLALPYPPPELRGCLYRVYWEALMNAVKHAEAKQIKGMLFCHENSLICEIHDDGTGLKPTEDTDGHYGLRNMRHRIEEVGGRFAIDSRAEGGTCITIQLPVAKIPQLGDVQQIKRS